MYRKIDISHKTVFFVAGFLALLWALFQILDVIMLLFVAIILMAALYPIIETLQRYKVPKSLAIAITYLAIVLTLISLISIVALPLIEQTTNLISILPQTIEKLLPAGGPIDRSLVTDELGQISKSAISFTLTIFTNFVAFVSVAVLTFYLLLERDRLDSLIGQLFIGNEVQAKRIIRKIEEKLGAWLRGQLALSLIIGILVYIILFALDIPYALPLAILAGVLEVVPVIGPIISAVPPIIIAYLINPFLALGVAGAFFVVQQLENNFIVPQVMKRAVGLNPIIVILAVAIGGKLLGVVGALLAVPITVIIQVVIEDVFKGEQLPKL